MINTRLKALTSTKEKIAVDRRELLGLFQQLDHKKQSCEQCDDLRIHIEQLEAELVDLVDKFDEYDD